jgi:poly-gamma-glutamate system protein
MNVQVVSVLSLGASGYGATRPEFHLLEISDLLLREEVLHTRPAAVSLGGERDTGQDYPTQLKESLVNQIRGAGLSFIGEPELRPNVAARMAVYENGQEAPRISAFINAGGSYANLGTSELALLLKPGLNSEVDLPPEDERGVLFEMASRGIPIIHLLFIEGLARRHHLPWDPSPLPEPGDWSPPIAANQRGAWFWAIVALHFALLLIVGVRY